MFNRDRILLRILFFIFSLAVCVALCAYHGTSGKKRIINLINEMTLNGTLTDSYWEVKETRDGVITISKYGYSINLVCDKQRGYRPGDMVSFIAQKEQGNNDSTLWLPERIHLHGTSFFKFCISSLAIIIVLVMCCCHFGLAKKTWGLILKEDSNSCRTD